MKRVLTVVACGGCLVARSRASSPGWGAAGATTGAGGAWPRVPPSATNQQRDAPPPLDESNPPGTGYGGGDTPDGVNYVADGQGGTHEATPNAAGQGGDLVGGGGRGGIGGLHEPTGYQQQQQQHQQHQQYDRASVPHQSRWAGNYGEPPNHHPHQNGYQHQHQHQHHPQQQQQQQQQYGHGQFPQQQGGGDALRLGTKWRSIVSRVKDAVRPGQPLGYSQADYGRAGGFQEEQGGGWAGDGGGAGGGGGAGAAGGGYAPPGSSWMGDATQHAGYAPPPDPTHGQQPQPDEYAGYGHEQQWGPRAAAHDPGAPQQGGYSPGGNGADPYGEQDSHHAAPPPAFFDPLESASSSARQGGVGEGETDAWQASPLSAGHAQPTPDVYSSHPGGSDGPRSAGDNGGDGYPRYATQVDGTGSGSFAPVADAAHGEHATIGDGLPSPGVQTSEGSFASPPPPPVVGQGWAALGADPTPAAPQQEQWQQGDDQRAVESGNAATAGIGGQGSEQFPAAGAASSPPPGAWTPPGDQGRPSGGHPDDAVAEAPPRDVRVAVEERTTVVAAREGLDGPRLSTGDHAASGLATGAHGGVDSYRPTAGALVDTMPSSADHGMAKVDWGKGAEEDEQVEEESGETVLVTGGADRLEREREEEALIRELERMDRIGSGDMLDSSRMRGSPPSPLEEGVEGENGNEGVSEEEATDEAAFIDRAVEHRLDVLFDSILEDGDADVIDDADYNLDLDGDNDELALDSAPVATLPATAAASAPFEKTGEGGFETSPSREGWGAHGGEAPNQQQPERWDPEVASHASPGDESWRASEPLTAMDEAQPGGEEGGWVLLGERGTESAVGSPSTKSETTGSMWGKSGRWESLPPLVVVVSESGEEGGEGREDNVDARIPLDPIELPPSAAADEIWNDQHLQDQLDAYWEQSRRGGAFAGGGGGGGVGGGPPASVPVPGGRQLSTYGGHLQPTYGPGDWVGKSSAMGQEPLPGAVDGISRAGVAPPRLYQGGQAPINIYGNVHLHLQQGGQDGDRQPSPRELSARERYYSQGETSWSGSQRGGH